MSSKSIAVFDTFTSKIVFGLRETKPCEIASLSKIMTCFVVCEMFDSFTPKVAYNTPIRVSRKAEQMIGTIAMLRRNEEIKLHDALHALMLPSGNDAATAIAENIGKILLETSFDYRLRKAANPSTPDVLLTDGI